jgi:lysophospholipase L1-like esterase
VAAQKHLVLIEQYLALGDSYTIGEGVALFHSFPYQLTQALREKGITVSAPEIIAKTGFTTGELLSQLSTTSLLPRYQLVTVLIGVNNQYRGLAVEQFEMEFNKILDIAIDAAVNEPQQVYVLSIPDYGKSPFASSLDKTKINAEISRFNKVKAAVCRSRQVHFIDITTTVNEQPSTALFVEDGLHPAAAEYRRWVSILMEHITLKSY